MSDQFDTFDLSPRHQRVLALGVHGGADDDEATPAEGETTENAGAQPAEGEATEGGETPATEEGGASDEGESASEASIEVPALPGDPEAEHPLALVPEADLRERHQGLQALWDQHRPNAGPAQVAALQEIRAQQSAISDEMGRRRAEAAAAAEVLSQLDGAAPELGEAVPVPALASAGAVIAGREGAQTAAAQDPPPPAPERPHVALLAAASSSVAPPGTELDLATLGRAVDGVKRGRSGEVILAAIPAYEDQPDGLPTLLTTDNGVKVNDALIREAVEDWKARRAEARGDTGALARRAAAAPRQGAICGPLDIIRDIPDSFSAASPVADIFPSRPAGRLGFQFTPPIDLAAVLNAVAVWTEEDQAAVDPDDSSTWKPCVEVPCQEVETCKVEAITGCLTFDNTTEMSAPETIGTFQNALRAQRARVKDGFLLQHLDALSSAYTAGDAAEAYGAMPAVIEVCNTLIAQVVYANRIDQPNYTLILDPATVALLRIDMSNRGFGMPDVEDVVGWVLDHTEGITQVVPALDASLEGDEPGLPFIGLNPPGDPADELPVLNGEHRLRFIDPAAALYAETGEQNAGVSRSPEMMRQNKAQYFIEEYLMLCKHGSEPWAYVDVNLCADGARAGAIEPHRCAISGGQIIG